MTTEVAETKEPKWLFTRPVRCPRCRGYHTYVLKTDPEKGLQHMRCRHALCRSVRWVNRGVLNQAYRGPSDEQLVTSDEAFDCPHCRATYKRRSDLTKHLKREHGSQNGETNDGESREEAGGPHGLD
jgi:hypothetical protein